MRSHLFRVLHFLGSLLLPAILAQPMPMAMAQEPAASSGSRTITGFVQNQDLRRVPQAIVELRDQEGTVVADAVTNDAGEFTVTAPAGGSFSVSAVQETYRSEYVVLKVGTEPPSPIKLTLTLTKDIALDIVSPLPPIQYKASSETYSLSRKEIEQLPRGNNNDVNEVLATIPGAAVNALKQTHIRQEHSNLQFRIDGVPIPDTVTTAFADLITPRTWERADFILGGLEAQYGNRTAAVIDITSKSGTKPGFGSLQMFGGSNETVNPSFEYGGKIGEKFRYYVLNSYLTTNRGIEPPTLGKSVFHDQSERNQTYLRGDYQLDNTNNFTWLFLNSVAKYQIPTLPGLTPDPTVVGLIQAQDPTYTPVASQAVDQNQYENNQYGHMVWRRDVDASQFFSLAGYFRQTRATFKTDPFNVLSYTSDPAEPFSASSQDREAYSLGVRLDYTNKVNSEHLLKYGFQIDRTQAVNKTRISAFARDGVGNPTGPVIAINGDRRIIGWREELWVQDQYTPNDKLTFNLGLRFDYIQALTDSWQISPRVGVTYKAAESDVFHAYYGRLFTPPNLESVAFLVPQTVGTTAEPENLTTATPKPERSHYFEVGWYHAFGQKATLQVAAYYKLNENMSDAGQFGSTPLLNYFAFNTGWQRGIDGILKVNFTENLTGRANVAWGQSKGYGLQSGHFLLEQAEINDINSPGGVFADHMQSVTSSAVLTYRFLERNTVSGQMLYASGLRTADPGGKTNSTHMPSYTTYNASLTHEIPITKTQKFQLGFDVINLFDQGYFYNSSEGSIGLGIAHAGMPRSYFFRAQYFF
ncbi:MAG TPA: TonB-dependent receptor [Nitrospiraceae bacterium]|nr:TonB-dependent receptor [Nitrospiraceae bacterium]